LLSRDLPLGSAQTAHEFASRDERWKLSITRDFIALTCRSYERWEDFKENLRAPLDALQALYSPAFFTRIGLRYRDVIRRSILALDQVGWSELLQPWVAGELASPEIAADTEHCARELVIRLVDGRSHLRVHHGLAVDDTTQEQCYVIDAD